MRALAALLLCVAMTLAWPTLAAAEKRVALVIGNSQYRDAAKLLNPVNDATDVAQALSRLDFEVIDGLDLDKRGMERALARFSRLAADADAAIVFFAGHGLQLGGQNYLVPIDAKLEDQYAIPFETMRVDDVVAALSGARIRVLILDACRNNPVAGRAVGNASRAVKIENGLARIEPARGMVIAYATQPNQIAVDGTGRNSPFTAALVREIGQPGLEVGQLFRRVAFDVNRDTNGRQTPELSVSLLGDFYLNRTETDAQAWAKLRGSDDVEGLRGFVARFPASVLADAARARIDRIELDRRERNIVEPVPSPKLGSLGATSADPPRLLPSTSAIVDRPPGLVEDIQRELLRLGCYAGRPTGRWDSPAGARALKEFSKHASIAPPTSPEAGFLDELKAKPAGLCRVSCAPRQVARGDACVAKTCAAGSVLNKAGACVAATQPRTRNARVEPAARMSPARTVVVKRSRPASPVAARAGRRCFDVGGRSFC